jgi:AmiR/NasT family two-component response regulator
MPAARLLIVEDERITAEDLRDILTELGYVVVSIVSTGSSAIATVEREAPDLVLMDIRIQGDLDGTQTAGILRERFDTPIVFLTAHSDEGTLSWAKVAEPLGYVVKRSRNWNCAQQLRWLSIRAGQTVNAKPC